MESLALMPKYDDYKDSGVDWLGCIPKSWNVIPVKRRHQVIKLINKRNHCDNVLSLTLRGVVNNNLDNPEGLVPRDYASYQIFEKDDLVFKLIDLENLRTSRVGIVHERGIMSPAYIRLKINDQYHPRYAYYYFYDLYLNAVFNSLGEGVRSTLGPTDLLKIAIVEPPHNEQIAIASFLDKKLVQIDDAIAIKVQQISLLKERKQIIIQQAVSQGLNPNVPMKDSGVDWIGNMPRDWVLKKIKHVTSKIGSGVTPTGGGSSYLDDGVPLLRSQNIHFDRIDFTDVARISNKIHESMSNSKVKKGDVLLNITGGSIGRCHYVDSSDEINVNQHVCIVRPKKIIKTVFLNAVLASQIGQGQIWYFQQGGGREGLNFQSLKNFYIVLPPEVEQIEIIQYIDEVEKKFYSAIQIQLAQIEKLKEYKTTLINSAVTGKIKITPEMVEQ